MNGFDDWRGDPFAFLGVHDGTLRVFLPGARDVSVVDAEDRPIARLIESAVPGLFTAPFAAEVPCRLAIDWPGGRQVVADPYGYGPTIGDIDIYLFGEGRHRRLATAMGAVPQTIGGVAGTAFSVWAPNARAVSVLGAFCGWDRRRLPMRRHPGAGIWDLFVPGVGPGEAYKFAVEGADGVVREKADPLARAAELPPATASIVAPLPDFAWGDDDWMAQRAGRQHAGSAISIYEVHAGSWMRPWGEAEQHDWEAIGDRLIPYVVDMGFTHIELMPIMEHPFGGSWGYQPLSQFAPSARYGDPAQFARFVDRCHRAGIGVILDWVPAHFPSDAHGLAEFDGTALYEHADPKEGWHPDWKTAIYNLGRTEVAGMLIASALWWLETFHVDGLRVDAVASMLYRDYSRREGEWVPNERGGRENLESIAFLRALNTAVAEVAPSAMMIAEESTAFPGVTAAPEDGGLGFRFKWNMGWMNDTLRYMETDPVHRRWHHGLIDFGLHYAFSERFVLPLSHDEVVHGKGSLVAKMPGDRWQRFANLRAYFSFMWAHPGKKLLFMGGELAQEAEWNHDRQIDWPALADPAHAGIQHLVRDLNALYREAGALHESDADERGFQWLVGDDAANSVFAFLRRSPYGAPPLLCVVNMTPVPRAGYRIGVPKAGRWVERLNSDAALYGGGNMGNDGGVTTDASPAHGQDQSVALTLPPLACLILCPQGDAA